MAASIRNRMIYKLTVRAVDIGSSKIISNAWYYRNGLSLGPDPGFGVPVIGSDISVFLASFRTNYGSIRALLNTNYHTLDYTAGSLTGKKYSSPAIPIFGMLSSLGVTILTATPHLLTTGDHVNVFNVNTPAAANGLWAVTVLSPTSFQLTGSSAFGTWSGDGFWQLPVGKMELLYDDVTTFAATDLGSVTGDALPLFAAASVRRLNGGTGRHYRSRLSLSPMSESDSIDGSWVPATRTAWATALATFLSTVVSNGSSDIGQATMLPFVLSTNLALGSATPFAQSESYSTQVTQLRLQPNAGSIIRRKPRLTSAIL